MASKDKSSPRGTVDPTILREIVRRIVDAVQPEKIILFGSAARARWGRTAISTCSS